MQQTSRAAAALDVLASLAEAATRFDYVKPRLSTGDELAYVEGRHPMMERLLVRAVRGQRPRDRRRRRRACSC